MLSILCIQFFSYFDNLKMHITVNGLTDEITTFPILPFLLPYLIIAVYWQELCEYYSSDLYSKYKKNKCYKYISTWFLCLLFVSAGFDCPVCSKFVCSDEIEDHLLMCFSKPRLNYNGKINLHYHALGHSFSPVRSLTRSCNLQLSNRDASTEQYRK